MLEKSAMLTILEILAVMLTYSVPECDRLEGEKVHNPIFIKLERTESAP